MHEMAVMYEEAAGKLQDLHETFLDAAGALRVQVQAHVDEEVGRLKGSGR
jgi:hypothetical protein